MTVLVAVKKTKGIPYVSLVEAYYETVEKDGKTVKVRKLRTVRSLGSLKKLEEKEPGALDRLKREYEAPLKKKHRLLAEALAADHVWDSEPEIKGKNVLLNYGIRALQPVWDEWLGLPELILKLQKEDGETRTDLNRVLSYLTFYKVADRAARGGAYQAQTAYIGGPLEGIGPECLGEALDFIDAHKEQVFAHILGRIRKKPGLNTEKLFCVRVPAENAAPDPFEDPFDIRPEDGPPDAVLLVMDADGIPLDFVISDGYESEIGQVAEIKEELEEKYGSSLALPVTEFGVFLEGEIQNRCRTFAEEAELFRLMLRKMPLDSPVHEEGHVAVCVLAFTLLRLVQLKLAENKIALSPKSVQSAVAGARVLAMSADGQDGEFMKATAYDFIHCDDYRGELYEDCDEPIDLILRAVGLEPLEDTLKPAELASKLKLEGGYQKLAGRAVSRFQAAWAKRQALKEKAP